MSDDTVLGESAGMENGTDEQLHRVDDAVDLADPSATDVTGLPERARLQTRLSRTRTSVRDATVRARNFAALPSRPPAQAIDETDDAPVSTLTQRVQSYRPYLLSAAGAIAAALVFVVLRRARGRNCGDTIDLGEWHLLAQPIDE